MGTHLTLDDYRRLPLDVRGPFDDWLRAEGLTERSVVALTLGEGFVTIVRYAHNAEGKRYLNAERTAAVTMTETVPISSLPPQAAFG